MPAAHAHLYRGWQASRRAEGKAAQEDGQAGSLPQPALVTLLLLQALSVEVTWLGSLAPPLCLFTYAENMQHMQSMQNMQHTTIQAKET